MIPIHQKQSKIGLLKKFSDYKDHLPNIVRYGVNDYNDPNRMIFKTLKLIFEDELYETDKTTGLKKLKSADLQSFLDSVDTKINESVNKLSSFSRKFIPTINSVSVETDYDLSSGLKETPIKVRDASGVSHYLGNRGFGTQKRMFMAIMDWTSEVSNIKNVIRCYDEPDNSLHIEAQRSLFRTIQSFVSGEGNDSQAVICTHSLFMIDSVPVDSIRLISRSTSGKSNIEYIESIGDGEVQEFMKVMCREMGLSNSHIFFEKAFIIVEGPSEMNYLPLAYRKLFNSSLSGDGITLINLMGNGAAVNFLKLLMTNKFELCYLFLDSDTKDFRKSKMKKSFNTTNDYLSEEEYNQKVDTFFNERVFMIGTKEFEDAFLDQSIIECLNVHRPLETGQWRTEDIASLRSKDKFSDEIIKTVYQKTENPLSKPELGTLLGNTVNETDIPETVVSLFNNVRKDLGL